MSEFSQITVTTESQSSYLKLDLFLNKVTHKRATPGLAKNNGSAIVKTKDNS